MAQDETARRVERFAAEFDKRCKPIVARYGEQAEGIRDELLAAVAASGGRLIAKGLIVGLVLGFVFGLLAGQCFGYELPTDEQIRQLKVEQWEAKVKFWPVALVVAGVGGLFFVLSCAFDKGRYVSLAALITVLALVLWAGECFGAAPACIPQVTHRSSTGTSLGSGILIHKDQGSAWVLTVGHLFDEGTGGTDSTEVVFRDPHPGWRYVAQVVHVDLVDDFAVLKIPASDGPVCDAPVCKVSTVMPAVNEPLWAGGYSHGRTFRWIKGRLRGTCRKEGGNKTWLNMVGATVDGDSGGIMCNSRGELVAVLSGTNERVQWIVGPAWLAIRETVRRVIVKDLLPAGLAARPRQGYLTPMTVASAMRPPDT